MSVLIKGMEMPQDCGYCIFERHTSDGYECLINGTLTENQKCPDDCPLVPVPPHGDLIDRDALIKGSGRYIISFGKEGIDVAEINRVPTIIPAEEEI